ncbi:UNVERIFIED_ORG: chloramphenicol phosphotransferase [Roseateles sp. XES5]|nr:AAA family ATPase [Roseateles sp. XES5]
MKSSHDENPPGFSHVIILNGVGSVGKSSTARAMQAIACLPMLHVSMDSFLEMMPEHLFGHPDGLVSENVGEREPAMALRVGPVLERALAGMRHAVAAMAAQGNHLIVDEVMIGRGIDAEYRELLSACNVKIVGIFAPLDILEEREKMRGDREIGLARWQFERVHDGRTYDLEIEAATPEENATRILQAFGLLSNA